MVGPTVTKRLSHRAILDTAFGEGECRDAWACAALGSAETQQCCESQDCHECAAGGGAARIPAHGPVPSAVHRCSPWGSSSPGRWQEPVQHSEVRRAAGCPPRSPGTEVAGSKSVGEE